MSAFRWIQEVDSFGVFMCRLIKFNFFYPLFPKPVLLNGPHWVQMFDTEGLSEAFLVLYS